MEHHQWLIGPCRRTVAAWSGRIGSPEFHLVDCAGAAGPFPATAQLLRHIIAPLRREDPAALRHHAVEIITLAPDLWAADERVTLPARRVPDSYSRMETLIVAEGVVDLLHAWAAGLGRGMIVYTGVEQATPSEAELLAVAVRMVPAELVRLVVCSASVVVPQPLATALAHHAVRASPTIQPAR